MAIGLTNKDRKSKIGWYAWPYVSPATMPAAPLPIGQTIGR